MKKLILACALLSSASAWSAPVALVESAEGVAGVEAFDFLEPGTSLDVTKGTVTLSYMENCRTEVITGGHLTVGDIESEVDGGKMQVTKSSCGGYDLVLAADTAVHSGAVAMRDVKKGDGAELTTFHVSPVFILPKHGKVTIKRLDEPGERHRFRLEPTDGVRVILDLQFEGVALVPGGHYMVSGGGRSIEFTVDKTATAQNVALVSRLIPL